MATAILTKSSPNAGSWHDQHRNNNGNSTNNYSTSNCSDTLSQSSNDGYLRYLNGVGESQPDLNNSNNKNIQDVGVEKKKQSASVLAGKYLLFPSQASSNTNGPSKSCFDCINIQTREPFICKILPRSSNGLAMLAAYHRLEESSSFVNQVVEAIMTPKMIYFIMPKNYGNLHTYVLAKKKLREPEAANIFKQMVSAVQHCHSKGVIIRDIKLGRFVFADKAKSIVKLESLEDVLILVDPTNDDLDDKHGCPNYVSPEKAEMLKSNLKYPGKATDMWCLGVMLYTMLSGRYPFNDSVYPRLLHKIRTGTISIPQGLSQSASSLVGHCLNKSPSERPSCSQILRHPFIKHNCVPTSDPLSSHCSELRQQADKRESLSSSKVLNKLHHDQVVPN